MGIDQDQLLEMFDGITTRLTRAEQYIEDLQLVPTAAGAAVAHNLLDAVVHLDTVTNTPPARGSLTIANATPEWDEVVHPAVATQYLRANAADPGWAAIAAGDLPVHTHAGAGEGGPLVVGTTDTGATAGSILFAGAAGVQQQDNTNLFWDDGANELGVGINTPDGTIHAHTATAGAVTAFALADDLVVENSGDGGISILTPAANIGSLLFGSPADNAAGGFDYDHSADQLFFIAGGGTLFYIDPTSFYAFGPIIMGDENIIGLGAAAGRIEFNDEATDEIIFLDCYVGIGTPPDEDLHVLSSEAGDGPTILVENTNAGISPPTFDFYKNSASPADGDYLGAWDFYGNTSTGAQERYAYFFVKSLDVTNGDTGGGMDFRVVMDSTERSMLEIEGYNGSVNEGKITINKDGQDVDFKVEASGVADALEVQGSDGEITLGALGAGFVQSTAGGILSSAAIIAGDLPAHDHSGAGEGGSLVIGATDTDATAGSVFFAGAAGVIQQDNAGLFYDDTNNTVGIRDNTPHAVADALYVPWITGDTQTTSVFGSSNASNDQTAISAASYDAITIIAQAQSSSAVGGTTNSATATDFGVLGWATGAAGGVSAQSATGTALYVNLTGAGTAIADFRDNGATVWSILDGGKLLCGATGTLDLNGVADALILDADGDTTISAPTDDQIDIEIAGADDFTFTANSFNVLAGSSIYLSEYMYHLGDTNTNLRFETDKVTLEAGGAATLEVVEDGANNYVAVQGAYFSVGITAPDKGMHLAGTDGNSSTFNIDRYQAGSAAPPSISLRKSRNNTPGGLTIVQNGDVLGRIAFRGYDGGTLNRACGYFEGRVDGVPGPIDLPGLIAFFTTPDGSGTAVERLVINNAGYVGIGITTALAQTHIDQTSTTVAIPVLALDQADVSEGFINFIGSDRGVITGATNSVGSVRAEINGTVYRLALYADA